ncbi:MAG: ParB/RepB/Spo0J family partition protein [Gammaproteobacteria bacterium]|nr:ParB/RepB/Spo0J family partition protein [Gammaproteobacteria bacterium]
MAVKKRRLGRGLDALLMSTDPKATQGKEELRQLPVDMLQRGRYQPRTHMDKESLEELANSIKVQGIVQPVVVRELSTGGYELIAGERRWRAAQLAGLDTVPAVIRNIPDEAAIAVALIENIQREDLNPIEEAGALQRLIDEFGMTHQRAADNIGRSRAAVSNLLRLLGLSAKARDMLAEGQLDMGHARALLSLPATMQDEAAITVARKGMSVRQTEQWVRRRLRQGEQGVRQPRQVDPDVARLQQELSERLGAAVVIQHGSRKGRLIVEYHGLDELDGILARIR